MLYRSICVQPRNVSARQHHGREVSVIQMKYVAHHLVLMFFDDASVNPLNQAGRDFSLGYGAGVAGIDAE